MFESASMLSVWYIHQYIGVCSTSDLFFVWSMQQSEKMHNKHIGLRDQYMLHSTDLYAIIVDYLL